jgi:hypothetical protein
VILWLQMKHKRIIQIIAVELGPLFLVIYGAIGQIGLGFFGSQDVTQSGTFAEELFIYGLISMIVSPIIVIVLNRRK